MIPQTRRGKLVFTLIALGGMLLLKKNVLGKPLETLLHDEYLPRYISMFVQNTAVVVFSLWGMNYLRRHGIAAPVWSRPRAWHLFLPAVLGLYFLASSNADDLASHPAIIWSLYLLGFMAVGFAEEFALRGMIQNAWMEDAHPRRAVVLAAALFGIAHYINLFEQPDNFEGITSQVLFAFCIGTYFGAVYYRTGNLIMVSILHGLVDIFGGLYELQPEEPAVVAEIERSETLLEQILLKGLTYTFFSMIFFTGWFMLRKDALRRKRAPARETQPVG